MDRRLERVKSNTSFDDCLELAGVQVAPRPLGPTIDVRSLGGVRGVRPHLALLQDHLDHHPLVSQRQVNLLHRPRGLESKKVFVQRGAFHGTVNQFEKLDSAGANENSQWNR